MNKDMKKLMLIAKDIHESGGTVYFVGGYVRDLILGRESKDIDVEIHGISVQDTKHILEKYGVVDEIGASFGILMIKGLDIDFAFPRTESRTGSKHTDFEVLVNPFLDTKEAVRRRDFTMNSVMKNVITGEYVDLFNGINDINNKIIRVVDNETFIEDSLRPLRACQFSSRLGFKVDSDLIELSKSMDYSDLSRERVIGELDKALLSDKPSIAFNYLFEMGIIEKIFPELFAMKGSEQNPEFHPEGDVWNHVMLVIDNGAKVKNKSNNPRYFMYACLLHDLAKPETLELIDGKYTNHGHDKEGAITTVDFLKKWTNETKLHNYVSTMTLYHMKAHKFKEMRPYKVSIIMTKVDMNDLLLLNLADSSGRDIEKMKDIEYKEKIELIKSLSNGEFGKIKPYVDGKYLLDLGFEQGKELGKLLAYSYDLQLRGKSEKDIKDILYFKKNPLPKPTTTDELVDIVYQKEMKKGSWKKDKQNKIFTRFKYLLSKDEFEDVKLKKSIQGIPYAIGIYKVKDGDSEKVFKLFLLPDMAFISDVRHEHTKIIVESYYMNHQTRMDNLNKYLKQSTIRDNQERLYILSYSTLNKKV